MLADSVATKHPGIVTPGQPDSVSLCLGEYPLTGSLDSHRATEPQTRQEELVDSVPPIGTVLSIRISFLGVGERCIA